MKRPSFSALKVSKFNKTWVVLGVAIGIGLLAAWIARSYLVNRIDEIESQNRGKNVQLVVAKSDLPRGARLSSENLAVRPVPMDYSHSSAILPEHFERIEGQTLAVAVKKGDLIFWPLLEGKKAPTFSARVDSGRRAITVAVDEINSISGLLEPGDLIDLMVSFDRKGRKNTLMLMQGVRVLATGQRSTDDPKSGERRMYSTVTLDTDPQQAQQVVLAREVGRLTALMRNPNDVPTSLHSMVDLAALLAPAEPASAPTAPLTAREVPVLYGGTGGRLPADGLRLARPGDTSTPVQVQIVGQTQASTVPSLSMAVPPSALSSVSPSAGTSR